MNDPALRANVFENYILKPSKKTFRAAAASCVKKGLRQKVAVFDRQLQIFVSDGRETQHFN